MYNIIDNSFTAAHVCQVSNAANAAVNNPANAVVSNANAVVNNPANAVVNIPAANCAANVVTTSQLKEPIEKFNCLVLMDSITGYDPVTHTPTPPYQATAKDMLAVCDSPQQRALVGKLRAAYSDGDDATADALKKRLPAVLCNVIKIGGDGSRKNANALTHWCVGMDIDDLENPDEYHTSHIINHEKEWGIIFVQKSARHGLHILFRRKWNETIWAAITRLAGLIGCTPDEKCKDAARAFFLTTTDDILFMDDTAFEYVCTRSQLTEWVNHFTALDGGVSPLTINQQKINGDTAGAPAEQKNEGTVVSGDTAAPEQQRGEVVHYAQSNLPSRYRNIPIKRLLDERIAQINLNGEVVKNSNRESTCFSLAQDLMHIFGEETKLADGSRKRKGNFALVYLLLQAYFKGKDVPEADIKSACQSALNYYEKPNAQGKISSMANATKRLLQTLEAEYAAAAAEQYALAEEPLLTMQQPQSELPEIFRLLTAHLPESLKLPAYITLLSVIGTYLPYHKFLHYFDANKTLYFTFFTLLVGTPASGKGSVMSVVKEACMALEEHDAQVREQWHKYNEEMEQAKAINGTKPTPPQDCVRLAASESSLAALRTSLGRTKGAAMLAIQEEFSQLLNSFSNEYAAGDTFYNKAFDNEVYSASYVGEGKSVEPFEVHLNLCMAGQPEQIQRLRKTIATGFANRIAYCSMPADGIDAPIDAYTPAEHARIHAITQDWLQQSAAQAGKKTLTGEDEYLYCPWIDDACRRWHDAVMQRAIDADDKGYRDFANRVTVYGLRIGYLLSYLQGITLSRGKYEQKESLAAKAAKGSGNPQKEQQAVEWTIYLMNYLMEEARKYFGTYLNSRMCEDYQAPPVYDACSAIYNALGSVDEFSWEQFRAACKQVGKYIENPKKAKDKLIADKKILYVAYNTYRKI